MSYILMQSQCLKSKHTMQIHAHAFSLEWGDIASNNDPNHTLWFYEFKSYVIDALENCKPKTHKKSSP